MRHVRTLRASALSLAIGLAFSAEAPAQTRGPDRSSEIGTGMLFYETPAGLTPLPLVDFGVDLEIVGPLVRATVRQRFRNDSPGTIEALYAFPLPERAAVHAMEMRIGDRSIVARVREREEAKVVYVAAVREGKKAALVEQLRPNLFRTSVANVNAGEEVEVRLVYLETARHGRGRWSLAIPLTFTPRYAGAPRAESGLPRPSGPRVTVSARFGGGLPIARVESRSHALRVVGTKEARAADLAGGPVVADRDLLLEWAPERGEAPRAAAIFEDRTDGLYGLVLVLPPDDPSVDVYVEPADTLYVVDVSGSMEGPSLSAARESLDRALLRLRPGDRFGLLRFDHDSALYLDDLAPATRSEVEAARRWVSELSAGGGTEIVPAIVRALDLMERRAEGRPGRVVLVTDGAVANEIEAFRAVAERLGDVRLHVIGIGAAPNRWLVRKLAERGRGTFAFVERIEEVEAGLHGFLEALDRPVATDLRLVWDGALPLEVYPETLPDLLAGEPLLASVRFPPGAIVTGARLEGRLAGTLASTEIPFDGGGSEDSGIAIRWARFRVESLLDSLVTGADPGRVREEIVGLGLSFGLVTPHTSLVAVEEHATALGDPSTVDVAGALPAGGTSAPLREAIAILLLLTGTGLAVVLVATRWAS